MELAKAYNPKETEDKIYQFWLQTGFFNPDKLPGKRKKTFTAAIPPPNITGELHMGHALNALTQDVFIRQKRMQGFKTLWLPGTDHAGIATQNVVEKNLKKEGKTRFDLGKEKFLEKVWQWKEKYGNIILDQFKKMGVSCDWSRTRFTLDKDYAGAVEKVFLHYHQKGWIYKGKRVVNWCPRCSTGLSDLELEYQEEKGSLWYIKYPLAESKQYIKVATTRPETMLGDSAIAVNPKDKRYEKLIGKEVVLPLINRKMPVIADKEIDQSFGTGAVKVTPAHDLADYKIGLRHNLQIIQIIDEKARIINVEKYQGLKVLQAREEIIKDLEELKLVEKIEDHDHQVPRCYRCKAIIEFIPSEQWFLKMDQLSKTAIKAVKSGKVRFYPKRWEKVYFDWLKKTEDWCISRQLWWGHKIPIRGTDDVLDTWFSSALWPFATLGWPKKTKDLGKFYPTDILSTARDIINMWVARMIFSGIEFTGKAPFHTVLIHPTVLTKEGKRMSKSLGTGIDPMDLIEKYGADATRFGIAYQLMGGQDIKFAEDNIIMGRKFCNKIWNASRFAIMQTAGSYYKIPMKMQKENSRITKQLAKTVKSVNKDLEIYQLGRAAHTLYDFFWHDFCDQYIEEFKNRKSKTKNQELLYILLTSLKLLHPFIPFITEEIYQTLPLKDKKKSLMVEDWPQKT